MNKQKENLAAFLSELEIYERQLQPIGHVEEMPDDMLFDQFAAAATGVAMPKGRTAAFFDCNLSPGDIRLLSQPEQITYVVVVKQWDWNHYLMVPYSHFQNPATNQEMRAEGQGRLFQAVLQAWNARTVAAPVLAKSWKIGTMPVPELNRLLVLLRHLWTDRELPVEVIDLTSPPIHSANDPRAGYLLREHQNLIALEQEDAILEAILADFAERADEVARATFRHARVTLPTIAHEVAWQRQAAAGGRSSLSEIFTLWHDREGRLSVCHTRQAAELNGFQALPEHGELEPMDWGVEGQQYLYKPVLFFHSDGYQLIGSGIVTPEAGDNSLILLKHLVGRQDMPAISCAADIAIGILTT